LRKPFILEPPEMYILCTRMEVFLCLRFRR